MSGSQGDSFAFGHGVNVEDRFDTKLEALLRESGDSYMVINAGVGGWGTLQEVKYGKDHLSLFNPDIVILLFCGNDPRDDLLFSNGLSDNKKGAIYFPGKRFIKENTHFYRFLYTRFHTLLHNVMLKRRMKKGGENDQKIEVDVQSANIITDEEWSRTLTYINDFLREYMEFNPDGALLVQATAPWNDAIRSSLQKLTNGGNLQYVDLYDDTISLKHEERRLPFDGHWSLRIHTLSAKHLHEAIIQHVNNSDALSGQE